MTIQPYPGNAAWPTEWQGSRLTGKYVSFSGVPMVGTVTFTPSAPAVFAANSKVVIAGGTVSVTLDANGSFDIILPATDDPDTNPTGWTYAVVENFPGGRNYSIAAPANGTRDLTAVAPVAVSGGASITRGMSAYEVAVANGFVGTEPEWLASLASVSSNGSVDTVITTTQAAYNALATKDPQTLYIITG